MTSRDAGFLYLERPHALLHIGCVAVVQGQLTSDAIGRRVEARLPRMRRYAQRAVPAPLGLGHPAWEDDPDLDVRDHISQWTLPAPGGDCELRELVATWFAQPLARGRPLWEMHVIDGLDGGRSALFQKIHHCMVDGMAGAQALDDLLDAEPRVRDVATARLAAAPVPDAATRIGRAVADTARSHFGIATSLLGALRGPGEVRSAMRRLRDAAFSAVRLAAGDLPSMPWNAPIGPRRRLAFARLPMEGVRRIRATRGGPSTMWCCVHWLAACTATCARAASRRAGWS